MPIDCHQCGKSTDAEDLHIAHDPEVEGYIDCYGPHIYLCGKCAAFVALFLFIVALVAGPTGNIVEKLITP